MLIEERIKPGATVIYDKRISSLKLLERFFGDSFWAKDMDTQAGFLMLERKDGEVKYSDPNYTNLEKSNYWANV